VILLVMKRHSTSRITLRLTTTRTSRTGRMPAMIGQRIRSCTVVRRNRSFGSGHRCSDWTLLFHIKKLGGTDRKAQTHIEFLYYGLGVFGNWIWQDWTNGTTRRTARNGWILVFLFASTSPFLSLFPLSLSPRSFAREKEDIY